MLLQIHDELIFEVPTDQLHHWPNLSRKKWSAPTIKRSLKVDVKAGPNWAAAEEVSLRVVSQLVKVLSVVFHPGYTTDR